MVKSLSLSQLLKHKQVVKRRAADDFKDEIKQLQLKMLRVQQGVWHKKDRVIVVFEGFDAAGKGGAIRKLTERLDPRGFRAHPIGPPTVDEQGKHWLYRFWSLLPSPGTIAIFDRSWYGRVLVEGVDQLIDKKSWQRAFSEINEFEAMLQSDGVQIIKIFLAISKDEQLKRFAERLEDPYKQWKLTNDDLRARKKWDQYVAAVDEMFAKTHLKSSPWHLVPADHKPYARKQVLELVTHQLGKCEVWIEKQAGKIGKRSLAEVMKALEREKDD